MTSGIPPATALARNAVTLSFCHTARSARTTMAILVSNRMQLILPWPQRPVLNAGALSSSENGPVGRDWSTYWRSADEPLEAMHAHFERHVYHRHSHDTYSFGAGRLF